MGAIGQTHISELSGFALTLWTLQQTWIVFISLYSS